MYTVAMKEDERYVAMKEDERYVSEPAAYRID